MSHNAVINTIISWLAYSSYYLVPSWETTDCKFLRLALPVKCNKPKHFQRETHAFRHLPRRGSSEAAGKMQGGEIRLDLPFDVPFTEFVSPPWAYGNISHLLLCSARLIVWATLLYTSNSLWQEGSLIWVKSQGQGSINVYLHSFATVMAPMNMMHYK